MDREFSLPGNLTVRDNVHESRKCRESQATQSGIENSKTTDLHNISTGPHAWMPLVAVKTIIYIDLYRCISKYVGCILVTRKKCTFLLLSEDIETRIDEIPGYNRSIASHLELT